MKMTVLYLRHTGHVLAALTRSATAQAPADSAPKEEKEAYEAAEVKALAGDALLARGFERNAPPNKPLRTQFAVAASDLAALTVDPGDSVVLDSPRAHYVSEDKELNALSQNWSVIQSVSTNSGGNAVTVTLSAAVQAETRVWVHALGGSGEGKRFADSFKPGTPTQQQIVFNVQPPITAPRKVLVALGRTRPIVWEL